MISHLPLPVMWDICSNSKKPSLWMPRKTWLWAISGKLGWSRITSNSSTKLQKMVQTVRADRSNPRKELFWNTKGVLFQIFNKWLKVASILQADSLPSCQWKSKRKYKKDKKLISVKISKPKDCKANLSGKFTLFRKNPNMILAKFRSKCKRILGLGT